MYMDDTQIEYMDEEHSDEYMDDTIVYMSRANAIRANNMSATNMCAARNIVTSGDNTSTCTTHEDQIKAKPSPPFSEKIWRCRDKGGYF
jgi:hypothetical protein